MVKKVETKNKQVFECEECGMKYMSQEYAIQCENWCKENGTCNIEIIKNSINEE